MHRQRFSWRRVVSSPFCITSGRRKSFCLRVKLKGLARLRPVLGSLLSFALLILTSACGEQSPVMPALAKDAVIVAFGDSLTEGTGAKAAFSYPQQLQKLTGLTVINAGVAGEISAAGLARLPDVLAAHSPDVVILCHGGNDLLRKLDKNALRNNLHAMIKIIRQNGSQIVLLGVPKPALLLGPDPVYDDLVEEHELVADLGIISEVLSRQAWKSDAVHPNAAGYQKIAEAVHTTLSEAGAL